MNYFLIIYFQIFYQQMIQQQALIEPLQIPQVKKTTFFEQIKRLLVNDSQLRDYIPLLAQNQKNFRIFKDKLCIDIQQQINSFWNFLPKRQVMSPTSPLMIIWFFFQFLAFVYYFIQVGLVLAYGNIVWQQQIHYPLTITINYVILLIWIIQIAFGLNRGYFNKGILIMDRKRILANYLRKYIIIDIFCPLILLVCIVSRYYQANWAKLFFIFKLIDLYAIDLTYQRILNIKRKSKASYLIIRIILIIFAMCHIIGVIFYSIDLYILTHGIFQSQYCWIVQNTAYDNIIGQPWHIQYLYSLYWGVNTMTTIAYGDIAGQNPYEVVYMIICFMSAIVIYLYALSVIIGSIFWSKQIQSTFTNQQIIIDMYMQRQNISIDVKMKVRQYLSFLFIQQNLRDQEAQWEMMQKLPQQMREALIKDAYKMFYSKLLITFKAFPSKMLDRLIYQVKQNKYAHNQILFEQGDQQDGHNIYLLNKGRIHLIVSYGDNNQQKLADLQLKDCLFGQYEFYTGQRRRYKAVSQQVSIVYTIERNTLKKIVQEGLCIEYFRLLYDDIIQKKKYDIINYNCFFCQQIHKFQECNQIFPNYRKDFRFQSKPKPIQKLQKRSINANKRKTKIFKDLYQYRKILQKQGQYEIKHLKNQQLLKNKFQKRLASLYEQIKLSKDNFEVDQHYDWRFYKTNCNFSVASSRINNKAKYINIIQ